MLVESACGEDSLSLKVTPLRSQKKPVCIAIQAGYLWNQPGSVRKEGDLLLAEGAKEERYVICCSRKEDAEDLQIPLYGPYRQALLTMIALRNAGKQT